MGFQILDEDEFDEDEAEGIDLGPDERDLDLMDGSWEEKYYSGQVKTRNWNAIGAGIALLVVASLLVPMVLVLFN
ncbi:MAG: hypothetical protein AB7J35_08025 [Dehalococcoidia bacterium]